MNANEFLQSFLDGTAEFVRGGRAELAAWTREEEIVRLTTTFLAQGDADQLAILSFRLRTWARRQNVKALVRAHRQLSNFFEVLGNMALAFIGP